MKPTLTLKMEIHTRITHQTLPMSFDITMWQNQQKCLESEDFKELMNNSKIVQNLPSKSELFFQYYNWANSCGFG